jgi:hypothetical protein
MIIEEYRMHAAMIGRFQFMFFPVLITIFALVISISAPVLLETLPLHQIYLMFHMVILVYGLGIGGFALFGDSIAERRFGQLYLLLETPTIQPIDFNTIFLVFYIKDVIYYILFSLVPIIVGIGISIPISGFQLTSVLFLFVTVSLTFLFGISFSFFLSSVYVRWPKVFTGLMVLLGIVVVGSFVTDLYAIENLVPPLMFQFERTLEYLALTVVFVLVFSMMAVKFIKIDFGRRTERFSPSILAMREKFGYTGQYSTFVAKEWLDMKRSRTLYPVMGAYIGPLIFLSIIIWFLRDVLQFDINFNIIFYSAMIGFFGMTIYSWLNIIDTPEFYQFLPVNVPQLIKTKLVLFALLTSIISTVFLIIMSILNNELLLLWLALIVAFTTTSYTVIATAYLTGLRTNVYLFSPKILGKFIGVVAVPLIILTITSFILNELFFVSLALILVICGVLVLSMLFMYRSLDRKWGKEGFSLG